METTLQIHALMTAHTALTLASFLSGPVMIAEAWRNRLSRLYAAAAVFPLLILVQRLMVGDRCVVQEWMRGLRGVSDPAVWAPDLYFVDASWMTYVVDGCIVSYSVGVVLSVALFARRRHFADLPHLQQS